MLKTLLTNLNSPFPEAESLRQVCRGLILAAVIVFSLLYFFQPFGLSYLQDELLWVCLVFGLITFATGMLYEYVILPLLPIDRYSTKWTLKYWIISIIGLIILISIANYGFLILVAPNIQFDWQHFGIMIGNTFAIGLIPTIISGLITQNRILKQNIKSATAINKSASLLRQPSRMININSVERDDSFSCASEKLLFVEAMQNYVNIWTQQDGNMGKHVLRNSLKNTCAQICDDQIIQCHRSFIVNISQVEHITGNAQGLTLLLPFDISVPVSRSFIKRVQMASAAE